MAWLTLVSALGLVLAPAAAAQIRVEGLAERTVAADRIEVVLELPTDLDSYSTSHAVVEELVESLRALAAPPCSGGIASVHVEVHEGERHRRWKGVALRHRLLVVCPVDPRAVEASAATLIDAVLGPHPALTLDGVTGTISPERDREIREAVLAEAVEAAWGQARAAARAAGSDVAHLVSVESTPVSLRRLERGHPHRVRLGKVAGGALRVELSPGFSGTSAFSGVLRYAAHVVAEFELSTSPGTGGPEE